MKIKFNKSKKIFSLSLILIIIAALLIAIKVSSAPEYDIMQNTIPTTSSSTLTAKEKIAVYADKHGYTLSDYPEAVINLLAKQPESEEFVLAYPEKKGTKENIKLKEYKNCTEVPLLIQWDTRWGYAPYGNGIVGLDGCGPTCLSMVSVYLTHNTKLTPDYIAEYAYENGYYQDGVGTMWSLMTDGAEDLGLSAKEIPLDEQTIKNTLDSDKVIICSVGEGDFTTKGHFIVLTNYNSGMISVNDPNSYSNSKQTYSYERLKPQIKNLWSYSKS